MTVPASERAALTAVPNTTFITILTPCPEKVPEGKRFAGWNREFDNGNYDTEINNVKLPGATVGVYSDEGKAWVAMYGDKVDISFDAGEGGRGSMPTLETVAGLNYYLPENKFEGPEDAKFLGWSDGKKTYDENDPYELTGDVTFTALWEGHEHEMIEHDAVDATCEKDGNLKYWECKGCKHFYKDSNGTEAYANRGDVIIPARGHMWSEPTYSWSDDNSKVTAEIICYNDDSHKKTETVDTTSSTTNPTCAKEGKTVYKAEFTNDAFETQTKTVTIDKTPHNWPATWEPVEGDDTMEQRVCETCGAVETRQKDHEHNLVEVDQADPTCEKAGMKAYWVCSGDSGCGKWYADANANQEIEGETEEVRENSWRIPALGHQVTSSSSEVEKEASCDDVGVVKVTRTCKRGHTWEPMIINPPALGHDWSVEIIKAATCTDDGLKHRTCRRCGKSEDVTIKALGEEHTWGAWVVTRPATATKAGEKQRVCENCGLVELGRIAPAASQKITKKKQVIKLSVKTKTVKFKKLKKKKLTVKPITVKKAKGKVTYKIVSGTKKARKALTLNKKTGKITVKKKTKKGTYKLKIKVTAAGNKYYKAAAKTVTIKVKVR